MTSGTGSGLVSRNKEGTQIVLAQFPPSGDLTSFGLTPSIIKTIAIPNDLQEWPTTALNGCTNLEKISVFGEEVNEGIIDLTLSHGFRNALSLTSIQFPSTVRTLGNGVNTGINNLYGIFPTNLKVVYFSKNLKSLGSSFARCAELTYVDLSVCPRLTTVGGGNLGAFFDCKKVRSVRLPSSVTFIQINSFACNYGPNDVLTDLRVLMWIGCTVRNSSINPRSLGNISIDDLVASGRIIELFVP